MKEIDCKKLYRKVKDAYACHHDVTLHISSDGNLMVKTFITHLFVVGTMVTLEDDGFYIRTLYGLVVKDRVKALEKLNELNCRLNQGTLFLDDDNIQFRTFLYNPSEVTANDLVKGIKVGITVLLDYLSEFVDILDEPKEEDDSGYRIIDWEVGS